jgi:hypothetical protein
MRVGHVLAMMQFGTLPADLTEASMRRFAGDVMPWLRGLVAADEGRSRAA